MGNIMERLNILQNHDRINNSPAERSMQHCSNTSSELESLTQFLLLGKARLNLNRRMVRTKPFLTGPYCLSIVILRHLLPHNQSQSIRQSVGECQEEGWGTDNQGSVECSVSCSRYSGRTEISCVTAAQSTQL